MSENVIAAIVPYLMFLGGSRRTSARSAPDRIPVKHGKKSDMSVPNPVPSGYIGAQLALSVAALIPVTWIAGL
jgi:hypothetical protein